MRHAAQRENPAGLLGAGAIVVWIVWATSGGGFFATRWGLLGALVVASLALALVLIPGAARELDSLRSVMLAALAAFVCWNFLSLLWADFVGEAWTGADKTLLYAVGFAAFALWRWNTWGRLMALRLFAGGIGGVAVLSLVEAATATAPLSLLQDGRLSGPVEYVNASVALWMLGFWPALYLAGRRVSSPPERAAFLALAALLLGLTLLGQSRGWLYLFPLAVCLYLLLARQRLRALLALALAIAPVPVALPRLLDISDRAKAGLAVAPALDRAASALVVSAAAAAVAGLVWAAADRRVVLPRQVHRAVAAGAIALAVVGGTVAGVGALRTIDDPRAWASARWSDFKSGPFPEGSERFSGALGQNRFAEWSVAWREFKTHPVIGIGSDNYAAAYLEQRSDDKYHPRYPHSTPLRLLSQLGLVGAALFAVAVCIAVALALKRRRLLDAEAGGAVGAALMIFAYWGLHGSIDWFWEIPALAAPAFGMLALAGAPVGLRRDEDAPPSSGSWSRRRRISTAAVGAIVVVACLVALLLPWASAAYQDAGLAVWRERPLQAFARFDRAASLNPLSGEPLVVAGIVATRTRDFERAESYFARARGREPRNWYVYLQLGLLAARERRYGDAASLLGSARRLNPREPAVHEALQLVRRREPVTLERLDDPIGLEQGG